MKISVKPSDMKVYIASPFFNTTQLTTVMKIETILGNLGISFFSPRLHGKTIKDLPESERAEAAEEAFDLNLKGLWDCNTVLHVLDDKDVGAAWEVGFWVGTYGKKNAQRPVFMYHSGDKALNIMLQQIAMSYTTSIVELASFFSRIRDVGVLEACKEYSDFGVNLT